MSIEPPLTIDSSTPLRAAWSEQTHRLLRASARTLRASHHSVQAALRRVGATFTRVRSDSVKARGAGAPSYDFRADRILRDAHAYWEEKRGTRPMPRRSDINPAELPGHLLPQLQLIDVLDGGRRFYFRLVGTAIVEAFGGEFTGKYTEDVIAADRIAFLHACYRMVVTSRRPVVVRSSYLTDKAPDITANRLLMPLSHDGEHVNIILGALTFEQMGRHVPDDAVLPYIDVVP
jgi:hypothetical protein